MAQEEEIIKNILEEGLDPHQATANILSVDRSVAKCINFLLLYGGGASKLAHALYGKELRLDLETLQALHMETVFFQNITEAQIKKLGEASEQDKIHDRKILDKAIAIKENYFKSLNKVKYFVDKNTNDAKKGIIYNLFGRPYRFDARFSYKATNYVIQGGAADIVKRAMITIDKMLEDYKTRMILQVHDELNFDMPKNEIHLIPEIQRLMAVAYTPYKLPLTTSVSFSEKSWHDLEKYEPTIRN